MLNMKKALQQMRDIFKPPNASPQKPWPNMQTITEEWKAKYALNCETQIHSTHDIFFDLGLIFKFFGRIIRITFMRW
jgi:hypothetical protein